MQAMTPSRPYFVRAIFDWVVDNDCTPYLSVFAGFPTVDVPLEFIEDEHITLNISPSAVVDFHFDNEAISFKARFSGVSRTLYIPMGSIVGLFAKENGQGMGFPDEVFYQEQAESLSIAADEPPKPSSLATVMPHESEPELAKDKASEGVQATQKEKKPSNKVSHLKIIK
jgi:stringent starvation protein B